MKPFLLLGGLGEPTESWADIICDGDTYEVIEDVMLKLIKEELLDWFRIIQIKAYEVI